MKDNLNIFTVDNSTNIFLNEDMEGNIGIIVLLVFAFLAVVVLYFANKFTHKR